ncbi:hypothetical protein AB1Y20_020279 [Prymnesium parvum]|uniref:Anoctamin n=1 Tax=Prymnesium parvum TaxID=97485 RepID=A0AB34JU82_PRYPA
MGDLRATQTALAKAYLDLMEVSQAQLDHPSEGARVAQKEAEQMYSCARTQCTQTVHNRRSQFVSRKSEDDEDSQSSPLSSTVKLGERPTEEPPPAKLPAARNDSTDSSRKERQGAAPQSHKPCSNFALFLRRRKPSITSPVPPLEHPIAEAELRPRGYRGALLDACGIRKKEEYAKVVSQVMRTDFYRSPQNTKPGQPQHDWETIVNEEPVLALISKKHPEPEFERARKSERRCVLRALVRAGLLHRVQTSTNGTECYILIWASEARLMREAERIGVLTPLQDQFVVPGVSMQHGVLKALEQDNRFALCKGSMYYPFSVATLELFRPHTSTTFFNSMRRQRLVISIMQAAPSDGGAGIDINLLLAGSQFWRSKMSAADHELMDKANVRIALPTTPVKKEKKRSSKKSAANSAQVADNQVVDEDNDDFRQISELPQENIEDYVAEATKDGLGIRKAGYFPNARFLAASDHRMQESYLGVLGDEKLFSACFLFHNSAERLRLLAKMRSVLRLKNLLIPRQFTKRPPIEEIFNYMGNAFAFYLTFSCNYIHLLYYLSPLALLHLVLLVLPTQHDARQVLGIATVASPVMSVVLVIAATISLEVWRRTESELLQNLNLHISTTDIKSESRVRARYLQDKRTHLVPGRFEKKVGFLPVGDEHHVYYFSPRIKQRRVIKSLIFTAFCALLCVAGSLGIFASRVHLEISVKSGGQQLMSECRAYPDDRSGSNETGWSEEDYSTFATLTVVGAALANGLFIVITNRIYSALAVFLTEWENHRTQHGFEESLIVKTFAFRFVNSFASLFYVAFARSSRPYLFGMKDRDSCLNSNFFHFEEPCDCYYDLTLQLAAQFFAREILERSFFYFVPAIRLAIANLRHKRRQDSKRQDQSSFKGANLEHLASRSLTCITAFMQSSFGKEHTDVDQLDMAKSMLHVSVTQEYHEVAISFGYVIMFGAAAPWLILAAGCIHTLDLHADVYKHLFHVARTTNDQSTGIGIWLQIFEFLSFAAIITNSFFVPFTSRVFDDVEWSNFEKMVLAVSVEHALLVLKLTVACFVNDIPVWVHVTEAFETYIHGLSTQGNGLLNPGELWRNIQSRSPQDYVSGHARRAASRLAHSVDSSAVSAGKDSFDPAWNHAAGHETS